METSFSISHFKVVGRSSIEIPSSTNATWKNTICILDNKHIKFVGKKQHLKQFHCAQLLRKKEGPFLYACSTRGSSFLILIKC